MKIVKPQKLGVLCKPFESGDACYFAVSILVFFPVAPPSALLPEVELWKFAAIELGDEPVDMGMPKQRAEILVTGTAYPYGGPRPVCAPRVAMGSIDKTLYVVGDRFWKRGVASDPLPFTEMPITYERAFGGEGYAPNPLGKGSVPIPGERGESHPLPNVEDPKRLIRSPGDRPSPAGFGPYDVTWPQRFSKIGTYDAAWLSERFPGFAKDMDWGIFNSAPEDQQVHGYFIGDEPFTLEYMHPSKAMIEGRLPGVRTRAFITQKTESGERFREIAMRLDTIRLFPHAERGILIFHGMLEIAEDDGADVVHLMVGCEDLGEAKSIDHYREVLAQRLDKKKAHLLVLKDDDLMPAPKTAPDGPSSEDPTKSEDLIGKQVRRGAEARWSDARQRARQRMIDMKLDPATLDLPETLFPPAKPTPALDDMPAVLEQSHADSDKAMSETQIMKAEGEQRARSLCAERGLDYDQMMTKAAKEGGGPPKAASEALAKLRETSERSAALGAPLPDTAAIEEQLRAGEQKMQETYKKFAQHFPAANRLEGEAAANVRKEVTEGHRVGRSFAGCDLTGADLSDLDLTKADFRGAMLECADLNGAELGGADFTGAVLTRANLMEANLFGAKLAGANLGSAKLNDAELGGADLTGAVLAKADLTGARLREAQMTRADFSEAILKGADFTRAQMPKGIFIKTDFSLVNLSGADMSKCTFIESTLTGVDFSGAKLASAVFVTVNADRAIFRDADLTNLRVVKDSSFEGADFRGAKLDGANLRGTKLAGSDFSGAHLGGADLSECDLRGALFYRAIAKGAQFVRADLTGADMKSINLMEGSLQKAIVRGADLRGANLFRADFFRTRADAATDLEGANVNRARVVPPRKGSNATG